MRNSFHQVDLAELALIWDNFYPSKYAISADILKAGTVDSPLFDWGASAVIAEPDGEVLGFLVVKRSAGGIYYKGPDPDQAHVSSICFRDPLIGVDLMSHAKKVLRARGVYKVIFGQDANHFFPGVPTECASLKNFLTVAGFEPGAEIFDFERDLVDYEPPKFCLDILKDNAKKSACGDGFSIHQLRKSDLPTLEFFLKREFPGRWCFDTLDKIQVEEDTSFVYGLFVEGLCEGFALTQQQGCKKPLAGAVWQASLGENWATLGPIGVSEKMRKKGLGSALLAQALLSLKEQGARRTLIDWSGLKDFYEKHGFQVARTYRAMTLRLDS